MIVKLNDNNLSEGYYSDEGYNEVLHVLENLSLQEGATFTFSSENNGIIDATFANNKFGTIIISLNCDNPERSQVHVENPFDPEYDIEMYIAYLRWMNVVQIDINDIWSVFEDTVYNDIDWDQYNK